MRACGLSFGAKPVRRLIVSIVFMQMSNSTPCATRLSTASRSGLPARRSATPGPKATTTIETLSGYVPVDYPILGAPSLLGVQALFAAQQQGKYAALRAMLMTETHPPTDGTLHRDATSLGLDWETMEFAMNGDAVARRVAANLARGQVLGVTGLPTIFVNGRKITGILSYADLRSVVRDARMQAARS